MNFNVGYFKLFLTCFSSCVPGPGIQCTISHKSHIPFVMGFLDSVYMRALNQWNWGPIALSGPCSHGSGSTILFPKFTPFLSCTNPCTIRISPGQFCLSDRLVVIFSGWWIWFLKCRQNHPHCYPLNSVYLKFRKCACVSHGGVLTLPLSLAGEAVGIILNYCRSFQMLYQEQW